MGSIDLSDRVAVVTGAGTGMGAAISRALAEHGARVAVAGIDLEPITAVATELEHAIPILVDVSESASVDAAFRSVVSELGTPDIVVHSAGIDDVATKNTVSAQLAAGQNVNVLADLTDDQWRRMTAVNLDGSFYVLRAALSLMIPRGAGSVVLIGSETGVRGVAGLPHYGASKGGVHALIRSAAKEAIPHGVRVNGIAPGVIDTPMSQRSGEYFGDQAGLVAPIGRKGRPEEIATVALFLSSDLASYVVGEIINVDGGRMAS